MFAPIVDEAKTSGEKVTGIWQTVKKNISAPFQTKTGIEMSDNFTYDESFTEALQRDEMSLLNYSLALKEGHSEQDAFRMTMTEASKDAQDLALNVGVSGDSVARFTEKQKTMYQVTQQSAGKGLGNIRKILNEYNSALGENADGLTDCGLKQDEFTNAVNKSNASLGGYLKGLDGAKASMMGYMGSLVKTIGMQMAYSIAISALMRAISDGVSLIKKAFEDSGESITEKFDKLSSELSNANSELSSLESELSNVESQIDALLEKDELTFADKEELSRLRSISSELENQISLAESLQKTLKESLSSTALGAYTSYSQNTSFYSKESKAERRKESEEMGSSIGNAAGLIIGGIIGTIINPGAGTVAGAAIGSSIGSLGGSLIGGAASDSAYDAEMTVEEAMANSHLERTKLEMAQEEAYNAYVEDNTDKNKEKWQKATQALNDFNAAMATHTSQLSDYLNSIDYSSLETDEERDEYRKQYYSLMKQSVESGTSGSVDAALDFYLNEEIMTDEIERLRDYIVARLNSGEELHFYNIDKDQFGDAIPELESMGISVEQLIEKLRDEKEAQEEAFDYDTYDMVEKIASLSTGVKELVNAFKEFNEEGILTAETIVKLNAVFGNLGDSWTDFVDVMTSDESTTADAAKSIKELAETHLNDLMADGGLKLNMQVTDEETGEKSWVEDEKKYETYWATINQLEALGVENAKEYVDALQQQAMVQETVLKMKEEALEKEELLNKENRSSDENKRLKELQNKTIDDYIRDTENQYGVLISDRSLVEKQKEYQEAYDLAKEFAEYEKEMSGKLTDFNTSASEWTADSENLKEWQELIDTLNDLEGYESASSFAPVGKRNEQAWEAIKDIFGSDNTKYDDYQDTADDLEAMEENFEEAEEHRQELFDKMIEVAEDANIDLSGIDVESFDPNVYGDGSVFAQVYNKIISELENADYEELADELEKVVQEGLDEEGLKVELDLNIDELVISDLESGYSLLQTAEAEMNAGTGLSSGTIKALAAEDEDYLDYLYEENGLIKLNTELWKERTNLKVDENLDYLEEEISRLEDERSELEEKLAAAEEDGDTAKIEKYTTKLEENTEKLQDNKHQLEILQAIYDNYANSVDKATAAQNEFTTALSEVQGLQAGFDQLDKIYADVFDKENFDFSSILNNQKFADAFGNLGDTYTDFIETVTNSPDDIEACQEAFDALATAYLWNSDVLAGVTDETRNATVLMLEQMGVANAAAIVDQRLAYNKEYLKYTTGDFADATYEEIYALYQECEAGTVTQQVLAELAAEKWLVNENGIRTSSDIDQLIALANSANATTATLERLAKAKSLIAQAEAAQAKADESGFFGKLWYSGQAALYNSQAQSLLNQGLEYEKIDASQFKVDYSGGSATNKAKSSGSSKEDKMEAFDWIEIAINRIEEAIDRLKTTATSTYKSLKSKLGAAVDEIALVNQQIAIQQQAYNRYMQEANSVGLSSGLAQKVQDGTIDINEYDSDTREKIKEYQEWLEKAYESADAMAELREELAKLYEDNFKSVETDFDNKIDLASHLINQYKTGLDMLEARGYLESTKYYAAMQDATKNNVTILEAELASLEKYFSDAMNSGEIEKYSESWYSMQSSINGVKEELAEANVELAEYAKTMREIEWGYFDYTRERISQLTQEADFLIDLMSNSDLHTDKGQLTDEGMATMGLHAQNYNVYMSEADAYAEEILNIDKELAQDPYNTELIERREELLALQQDSIVAAENEKQAIVSLVEEGINLELESLQELIDAYKDSLNSAKDLYEYEKKISEQTKNIANLRKQLSAYEFDTSEETRAKVQKLTVELEKAESELEETEYDKFIEDSSKLLDELYTSYSELLNQRLDNVDALIGDMITAVNDNSGSINETLTTTADNVGYTMTTNMQNIWNGATNALDGTISKYGDDFSTKFTAVQSVLSSIQANTAAMVAASDEEAQETVDTTNPETTPSAPTTPTTPPATQPTTPSTPEKTITVGGKINAKGAKIYDYAGDTSGENQYFSKDPIYKVLDEKNGYLKVRHHKLSSGVTGWFKKSDVKAYKTGGLVDYTGLAKVDGTPGKPELMLNAEDTKNFLELRDLLRVLSSQSLTVGSSGFGSPTLSGVSDLSRMLSALRTANGGTFGTTIGDVEITIPIERVDDYNDFVTKLRNDPKFENMLLDVTIGRLAGGSSLAKNKYKW